MSSNSLFHLNLKLNQTNKASQVVAESVAFLFSGDVILRCSCGLVLPKWIADGSVIVVRFSLRKVEENLLKAETLSLLKVSFSFLVKRKLHITVTGRFTLSWKPDWAPI